MSQKLMDAVLKTLVQDADFMGYFTLTPASSDKDKSARIINGLEPDKPITGANVPICLIYDKPGRPGRNYLVYEGKFCLDVYHKTSSLARQATERAFALFHDRIITDVGFSSYRCMIAYDSDFVTGISGVKGREIIFDVDYIRSN